MLYRFVRPITKATFMVFYKHIYTSGFEKIPKEGPVLIAANHPTAFIEPCLAACFQHRILNFIVRGDVFKNPFYIKLLKSLHLIPIFRFRDGFANLKNNQETFKYCNEVLRDQKAIFILSEGRTIQEKRLRTLQKGTARMAFGAYEEYGIENTVIVPMGFSYENANNWRYDVIMACAEPLYLKDYLALYKENPNQAIQQLTDDIAKELPEKMVIIADKHDDETSELLCSIWDSDQSRPIWPIVKNDHKKLEKEKAICQKFNDLDENNKTDIKHSASNYLKLLKKHKISDQVIYKQGKATVKDLLILIIGLLAFIPGFLFNALPVLIARSIAIKKVYVKEFYAPVLFASSTFLLLIWYTIFIIFGMIFIGWKSLLILIVTLYFGYLSVLYLEKANRFLQSIKFVMLDPKTKNEIIDLRNTLKKVI